MRLSAVFQVPRVDWNRFRAALHERLGSALSDAARQWLQATVISLVPVWSGASRATFLQLAAYVSYVIACVPVSDAPDRTALGIGSSTATWDPGETNPGIYRFTYSTTLPHLIINEYYNANTFKNPVTGYYYFHLKNPGPYHFQEAGKQAFYEVAAKVVLPGWDSILDVTTRQVG